MTDDILPRDSRAAQKLLSRSSILRGNVVLGYGVGLVAFIAALVLRFLLEAQISKFPFITFIPAVIVSALLAGSRAGVVCGALSFLSAWYLFVDPRNSLLISLSDSVGLGLFLVIVAVDIAIIEVAARAVDRLTAQQMQLNESQIALNVALRAKEVLLYEVNHRVKNSLQLVNSFLLLEAADLSDSKARSAIMDARKKVAVVARLHQLLYLSGTHDAIDLKTALENIVHDLITTAGRSDVELELRFSGDKMFNIQQASPLVLTFSEVITNSLKYGLSSKRPKLTVSAINGSDELTLVIRDNGPGMSVPTTDEKPRVGSEIVEGLVSQMRGKFVVQSDCCGTEIVLTVPTDPQSSSDRNGTS